jgi:hypothetical protein
VGNSWSDRLVTGGAFLLVYGAYLLFLKGPAANQQQQAFRIAVPVIGCVLGAVGLAIKASGGDGGGE